VLANNFCVLSFDSSPCLFLNRWLRGEVPGLRRRQRQGHQRGHTRGAGGETLRKEIVLEMVVGGS